MPRSGSELLQVLLHQNPRIYGSATSPLLEYQFGARANYELPEVRSQDPEIMKDSFINMCKSMAFGFYESITDRPIVCDKNRGWSHYYEWVDQWNESPKMICMVRDIRSMCASLERIYRKNRHAPIGPDNPKEIQNMTVDQRAGYWLNTQPIGLALQRTHDLFQRGISDNILFVKYESLCNTPEKTMQSVYAYLEEKSYKHDFDNIQKEVEEDCSHYGPYGNHTVKSKIVPSKQSDWEDILPEETADAIRTNYEWYYDTFNY